MLQGVSQASLTKFINTGQWIAISEPLRLGRGFSIIYIPGPYHQRFYTVRYENTAIAYHGHSGLKMALTRLRTSLSTDLSGIEKIQSFSGRWQVLQYDVTSEWLFNWSKTSWEDLVLGKFHRSIVSVM